MYDVKSLVIIGMIVSKIAGTIWENNWSIWCWKVFKQVDKNNNKYGSLISSGSFKNTSIGNINRL